MVICRFKPILISIVFLIPIIFAPFAFAGSYGMVEEGWDERIREGISKIADLKFEEGLIIFDEYIKAFPDNPGGYFYYAAGVQEKIQKMGDFSELKRFNKYAKKCQRLAKKRLRSNPRDSVARIFLGATDGYIGLLEARRRHLLRAFKNGIDTKKHLERAIAERQDIPETYFGLGMLYYFSSRKAEEEGGLVSWVIRKFITNGKDLRQEGIEMLKHVIDSDALSRDYARSAIMWIYLYEHDYIIAKSIARELAYEFTRDTLSRWVLGRVALVQGRCDEAKHWFEKIVEINTLLKTPKALHQEVPVAIKKAEVCSKTRDKKFMEAYALNEEILVWLKGDPKVTLEFQDEKNLIKFWKAESEWTRKKLNHLIKRSSRQP
jgi:tetratricopeptide (TPR) repeat protein